MFVIMETVGGCGRPVATRTVGAVARAYCMELANLRLRKPSGRVEQVEGGASLIIDDASYVAVEVEDCG